MRCYIATGFTNINILSSRRQSRRCHRMHAVRDLDLSFFFPKAVLFSRSMDRRLIVKSQPLMSGVVVRYMQLWFLPIMDSMSRWMLQYASHHPDQTGDNGFCWLVCVCTVSRGQKYIITFYPYWKKVYVW